MELESRRRSSEASFGRNVVLEEEEGE